MSAGDLPYRIYRLRSGGRPECIATTATKEGVGTALVTLGEEGEFEDATAGVMHRPDPALPGTWLVNPWPKMMIQPQHVPGRVTLVQIARSGDGEKGGVDR